ncbi:cytochrome P450, partial [Escherichia coli]|nr:cytochrome P450 [Escherichia coli]
PSLVICELLGVPYEDRDDFAHRSARQLDLSLPFAERLELQRAGRAYMRTLVERARSRPGDDILGMLIREHGTELTDDELVGIAGLLLL